MKNLNTLVYSALLLLCITGCKKEDPKDEGYEFVNFDQEYFTVDLYSSESDYRSGVNMMKQIRVAPGGTKVPLSELGEGNVYYADCYNDDYTRTNWGLSADYDNVYRMAIRKDTGFTVHNYKTSTRKVLLKYGKQIQRWKAIDAYYSYPSHHIWDSLTANEKNIVLTAGIYQFELTTRNAGGQAQTELFTVENGSGQDAGIEPFLFHLYGKSINHYMEIRNTNVKDDNTIFVNTPYDGRTYIMVRE